MAKRITFTKRLCVNSDGYIVLEINFSKKVKRVQVDYNQLRSEMNQRIGTTFEVNVSTGPEVK